MIALIKSENLRNYSLIGWKIVLGIMLLMTVLLVLFHDLTYADLSGQLMHIHPNSGLSLGLNGFVVIGALNAKSDVESNELNQQIIAVPNRHKLFVSKFISSLILYITISLLVFLIDRTLRYIYTPNNIETAANIFIYCLAALTMGYLAYALSLLTKSTMVAVGFLTIIPTLFLGLFREMLPAFNRILPFDAINYLFFQNPALGGLNNYIYI